MESGMTGRDPPSQCMRVWWQESRFESLRIDTIEADMETRFAKILKSETGLDALLHHNFPHGPVTVSMQDGSFFCWFDAFVLMDEETLYVFTEHYGYHSFEAEMLNAWNGPREPKKKD